jgi:hypothetical protein
LFHQLSIITGLAGVLTLASCAVDRAAADPDVRATGQDVPASECPPNTPQTLAPAADQRLAFVMSAQGVQRYQCTQSTTGFTWTFVAPDADLFSAYPHQSAIHHFAGPT